MQEFKEGLELNSFKEEYKFLTPELNKNNFLPIGAVVSVFVAILSYTGWYYSDRSNKIENVAVQKTENISEKKPEIDNNSYVIIEENFSNNLPSSKINNDVNTIQEVNLKTNLNEDKVETMISKNTELSATANERDPSTELVLKATGNSWVEIEDMDGNILMTRLMRPGETYVVPDINGLTFNTGNAGALSLSQGDVIVSKLGEVGEIITAQPLNIKTFSNKPLLD